MKIDERKFQEDFDKVKVILRKKGLLSEEKKTLKNLKKVFKRLHNSSDISELAEWLVKPDSVYRNNAPIDLLGSNYATIELIERIDDWGSGAGGL